ncbi:CDP-glycerol glycerophosphotransferase family protein [Alkalibaculum bacchi]|uniref:CDP-glycerol glycerophosphotransferase family protein n=1 Tax=Alkalibaculum bacchi TaxID=645887 RepID=UPI0026EF79CF|nr:CDP-glycerol glycerophosphotransferase family protein [Alkalibaculum bacchi]
MEKLKHVIAKNKILRKIAITLLKVFRSLTYNILFRILPVNDKLILFCSHKGQGFSCNPKALYNEMKYDERYKDFTFVWAFNNLKDNHIDGAINVKYNSVHYFYYLAISKYWFFNAKMPVYYRKKSKQVYLQTWHGTPLKRLAADIEPGDATTFYRSEMSWSDMVKSYMKDSQKYDYMISANGFSSQVFTSAFRLQSGVIIETGYPRNDILVNRSEEYVEELKDQYNIAKNKKVILYAPTWRDNTYDTKGYIFELKVDFNKWREALGDEYVVVYKPHYLIYNTKNKELPADFVYDASHCQDINDLYLMSDIMVTDYSSVFFDYGVLRRPVLFYMYDLEEYRDQLRGFYLDIYKDLPGPILEKEEELLDQIIGIDQVQEEYANRMNTFYQNYCQWNDGKSSKKVLDIIFRQDK